MYKYKKYNIIQNIIYNTKYFYTMFICTDDDNNNKIKIK